MKMLSPALQAHLDDGTTTLAWCWRIARAHRAALIVDGCDYFRLVRQAMLKAQRQIFLIGWDLDTRIALDRPGVLGGDVRARVELATYGTTPQAFEALVEVLLGDRSASGRLPIAVPGAERRGCPERP